VGLLTPVNIKSHGITHFGISLLIEPKDYSDDEIIGMLKKVKITMVSKKNGKEKIESKPVSLIAEEKS